MHAERPTALLVLTAFVLLIPAGCAKKDGLTDPRTGPTADFSAAPRSGGTPLNVDFTDRSSPGASEITSTTWSFGDGTTSTARNAAHLYDAAGTYTVSLTVTTAKGSDTETKDGYIVVSSSSAAPTAAFTGAPRQGTAPLDVQFTDQSSPGGASITTWAWTFGDGGVSPARNPSHRYVSAGPYSVTLIVTSPAGADTVAKSDYIVVTQGQVAPTAQFSGNPTSGMPPLTVQFTDQSSPGTSPITARLWTFGDGAGSAETDPSHTYLLPGTYTVSLQVSSAAGQGTETKNAYIRVGVVSTTPPPAR